MKNKHGKERETTFACHLTSQKGGAGKTTLTVLIASYLHYAMGYDVIVVDCDYPQNSIAQIREKEMEVIRGDQYYKALAYNQLQRIRKKGYPVIKSSPEKVTHKIQKLAENNVDIIFYDMPGTVDRAGIFQTLRYMDYIFVPITADMVVVESGLQFAYQIDKNLIALNNSRIKELNLFWNMVDGREKSDLYGAYEKVINDLGLSLLKTYLPDRKRFRHDLSASHRPIFRSTLFPPDKRLLRDSRLDVLYTEILHILKLSR